MKYEFFAANKDFHRSELEQFEADNDKAAEKIIYNTLGCTDGAIHLESPIVSNPSALYGRSWFVYLPACNANEAATGRVFTGYLYTTGR